MAIANAQAELDAAVATLYRVFQPYRLGSDFSGCTHCVDPRESVKLATTPLAELTIQNLDSYSFNAMTTWGEVRHFKHFLPRLLELAAADPGAFLSFEVLLGKLDYGKWEEWPNFEQHAVIQFLQTFWQNELRRELSSESDDRIDMVLCGLGSACRDLNPVLLAWISTDSPPACRQLAQFVLHNMDRLGKHKSLANTFWGGRREQMEQVTSWLRSPVVFEHLFDQQQHLDDRLKTAVPMLAAWQSER